MKTTSGWKSQGCSTRVGDEMGAENRSRFAQLQRNQIFNFNFHFKAAKESDSTLNVKFKAAKESDSNLNLKLDGNQNRTCTRRMSKSR